MKFTIDMKSLQGFIQFASIPEGGDSFAYPQIHQFRGGDSLLLRVTDMVQTAFDEMNRMENNFHEDGSARIDFECGKTFSSQGAPHITVVLCRRRLSLLLNGHLMIEDVPNISGLLSALKSAVKKSGRTADQSIENNS